MIPRIFYNELTDENRNIVNAASGGKWMDKMAREVVTLLEKLASQGYWVRKPQWLKQEES